MSRSRNSHGATGDEVGAAGITPELALVSPELAAAGRRDLPDRPWEVASPQAGQAARRPGSSEASRARVERMRVQRSSRGRENLSILGRSRRLIGVLALAAIVVAAGLVAVGRLGGGGVSEPQTDDRSRADASALLDAAPLLPSAGYVVDPEGSFMTSASGRALVSFALPVRCRSGPLVLDDVPVRGHSIRFRGPASGRAVVVRLTMHVVDAQRVRGVVEARGPGCPRDPVAFSGRVS